MAHDVLTILAFTMVKIPNYAEAPRVIRYDFLDGLRAILALYVVLGHAFRTVNNRDSEHVSHLFHIFGFAHYSVCLFIILSGFCLTLPTLK